MKRIEEENTPLWDCFEKFEKLASRREAIEYKAFKIEENKLEYFKRSNSFFDNNLNIESFENDGVKDDFYFIETEDYVIGCSRVISYINQRNYCCIDMAFRSKNHNSEENEFNPQKDCLVTQLRQGKHIHDVIIFGSTEALDIIAQEIFNTENFQIIEKSIEEKERVD